MKHFINREISDQTRIIDFFKSFDKPFKVTYTNNSLCIEIEGVQHQISDFQLKNADLGFIKRTKEHILKQEIETGTGKVRYFHFNSNYGTHTDIAELDISGAYWVTALKMGLISKDVYEKGLKVDKKVRLIALGSIATEKAIFHYDPFEGMKFIGTESDKKGRSYFFHIARHVGAVMSQFTNMFPSAVLFFWVDALFIKEQYTAAAVAYFEGNGFKLKPKYVSKVEITVNDYANTEFRVFNDELDPEKYKVFTKPKSNALQHLQAKENIENIIFGESTDPETEKTPHIYTQSELNLE